MEHVSQVVAIRLRFSRIHGVLEWCGSRFGQCRRCMQVWKRSYGTVHLLLLQVQYIQYSTVRKRRTIRTTRGSKATQGEDAEL